MKVLITGGAGFIGSHVADEMKSDGFDVLIFDNLSSGSKKNVPSHKIIKGDTRNLASLKKAFNNVDYIVHNAALISVPESIAKPDLYNKVNIDGTMNVLIAAKECKVKKVIFASSAAVYGKSIPPTSENSRLCPLSVYAQNKIVGESYCSSFNEFLGLNTVSLRYFNVFGPRQNPFSAYAAAIPIFIAKMLNNKPITIFGDGNQTRDFIYVKNVAKANLLAIKKDKANGKSINIASGKKITINNLAKTISPKIKINYRGERKGDIKHSFAEISLSKKILGNYEKYQFKQGLKETIDWFKLVH